MPCPQYVLYFQWFHYSTAQKISFGVWSTWCTVVLDLDGYLFGYFCDFSSSNCKHITTWNLGNLINLIGPPNPRPWSLIFRSTTSHLLSPLRWELCFCIGTSDYAHFNRPLKNTWSQISDVKYTRVFILQTRVWTTPFQHSSMMGEKNVATGPERKELLKGKRHNQGIHVLLSWNWVRRA